MQDKTDVFVALVEVKPMRDTPFGPGVVGGFVRCYTVATDDVDAVRRIAQALGSDDITIENVEWCVRDKQATWEDPGSPSGLELVEEAANSGDVVFGEFHVWSERRLT